MTPASRAILICASAFAITTPARAIAFAAAQDADSSTCGAVAWDAPIADQSAIRLSRAAITRNTPAVNAPDGSGSLLTSGDNIIRGSADDSLQHNQSASCH